MKNKALYVLAGLLLGASLAACAPSQVGPDPQAIETNTQAVETDAQAIETSTQAAETRAQAIEYFNRGLEYQQQGNFDLAIEEYTEAIALDPKFADPYNNRGLA